MSSLERFLERGTDDADLDGAGSGHEHAEGEAEAESTAASADPAPVTDPGERPDVLRRFLGPRQRPRAGEVCELCATPIGDEHRHLVDVRSQSLRCSCRGCALLFDDAGTGGGRYQAVPDRYRRLSEFVLDPLQWTELQIPVGMAFFMHSTPMGATVAFYPSPGGATESELPLDTWDDIVAANPPLADVAPDVEAILMRAESRKATRSTVLEPECFIVPIDRCYELVGELRLHWHGFDGGQEVHARVEAFFDELDRRSKRVGAAS